MSVVRFRRGLTVLERRSLREYVTRKEVERAMQRAQEYALTMVCVEAMKETGSHPERARLLHQRCKGEESGQGGCLCECHDIATWEATGVQSGTAVEIGNDTAAST